MTFMASLMTASSFCRAPLTSVATSFQSSLDDDPRLLVKKILRTWHSSQLSVELTSCWASNLGSIFVECGACRAAPCATFET
jgi:hypothetical protein